MPGNSEKHHAPSAYVNRAIQAKLDELLAAGEMIVINTVPLRPNHVKSAGETKERKNLLSPARYGMSTHEDATEESRRSFGESAASPISSRQH